MSDDDFLKQRFTHAMVINGDLDQIQRLRQLIASEGLHVIFQKTSPGPLYIQEQKHDD
jgi:hypothetical protein